PTSPSCPTRRSSDLVRPKVAVGRVPATHILQYDCISALDCAAKDRVFLLREVLAVGRCDRRRGASGAPPRWEGHLLYGAARSIEDWKSTRLNSSHSQ